MINDKTTLKELAFIVCDHLTSEGLDALLVGGGVVSIYTNNEYESYNLDFISNSSHKHLEASMKKLGFKKDGRHFIHPGSDYFVEFPGSTLIIGDEYQTTHNLLKENGKSLKILSPTQSIMDRLAAFYFWKDRTIIKAWSRLAKNQNYSIAKIKEWSTKEGELDKFKVFEMGIKKQQRS